MPVGIRIKSGNVRLIAGDIDGWNNDAVQIIGDDAPCTVLIDSCYLGSTRYDTTGASVTFGSEIVQVSKKGQAAPHLATATIRNTQFDPDIEAHGGKSIRVGTSCVGQVTLTSNSFSQSVSGTPAEVFFEDFPTLTGVGALARTTLFGSAKLNQRVYVGGIFSRSVVAEDMNVAQQQFVRPGGLTRATVFGSQRVVQGPALSRVISGAGAIPTHLAFGATVVRRVTITLRPTGLTRTTLIGAAHVTRGVRTVLPTGIVRATAFGTPGLTKAGRISPGGIPSSAAFGRPLLTTRVTVSTVGGVSRTTVFGAPVIACRVRASGIVSSLAFGTPRVSRLAHVVTPTGLPSRVQFGSATTTTRARITTAGGLPSSAAFGLPSLSSNPSRIVAAAGFSRETLFGIPNALPLIGPSEAFGIIAGERAVEKAVVETLSKQYDNGNTWLGAYLDEVARQALQRIPYLYPATYRALSDPAHLAEGPLPQVTVAAVVEGDPEVYSQIIAIRYGVEVRFKVATGDQPSARRLGHAYLAAITAALTHRGSLGGLSASTRITGRELDPPQASPDKTVVTGSVSLSVVVEDAQSRYGGTDVPPPPGSPPPGNMPVTLITISEQTTA